MPAQASASSIFPASIEVRVRLIYVRAADRKTRLRSLFFAELRIRFFADAVLANFLDPPSNSLH